MEKLIPVLFLAAACGGKAKPAVAPVDNGDGTADTGYGGDDWDEYGGDGYADGDEYGGDYYGGDYGGEYTPPPPQPPSIMGTWATACGAAPTKGEYWTLTFVNTSTAWDLTIATFGDAGCAKRKNAVHIAGAYSWGAQSTAVPEAWEGTFTFTTREITADDKATAKALGKACGIKKMKAGVAVDILDKGCAKLGFKPLADCGSDNDVVAVQGLALRFGVRPADNDMCTAEKRPTALDTTMDIELQSVATGVAECDAMVDGYVKIDKCAKFPQEAKDAMNEGLQGMLQYFGSPGGVDDATKAQMAEACKMGMDAINQSLQAVGC